MTQKSGTSLVHPDELKNFQPEEQLKKVKDYRKAITELRGKYRDSMSSTEEFMKRKEEEKRLDL